MLKQIGQKLSQLFNSSKIDNDTIDNIEDILITSDISYDIVSDIMQTIKKQNLTEITQIKKIIKDEFLKILIPCTAIFDTTTHKPFSIILAGINGSGKTTTIGKLAHKYISNGKKVSIIACDTFRTQATEQLNEWAEITGATIIKKEDSDPSSLAYDGMNISIKQDFDITLIDTAGRLGNNITLMDELKKIIRTIKKVDPKAPSKTILVLDGTGGQNSIMQMEKFATSIPIDGLIITKTEGISKAGFLISIAKKYKTPIYFITNGEGSNDIIEFNPQTFVDNILN